MKFFSCCRWTFMDIQQTIKANWETISILNCFPTTVHLKSLEVQPSNQACVEFGEMHPLFSTSCITHPPLSDFLPQLFNIFANCLQRPLALGQQHFRILTHENVHEERSHINLELKKKNFRRFALFGSKWFPERPGDSDPLHPGCSNTAACQSH